MESLVTYLVTLCGTLFNELLLVIEDKPAIYIAYVFSLVVCLAVFVTVLYFLPVMLRCIMNYFRRFTR